MSWIPVINCSRNMMMVCRMRGVVPGVRQECSGEAFGANLECESAIPSGHETARNERAERVRDYKEACEPPMLA
jgi:hypothetical protein